MIRSLHFFDMAMDLSLKDRVVLSLHCGYFDEIDKGF